LGLCICDGCKVHQILLQLRLIPAHISNSTLSLTAIPRQHRLKQLCQKTSGATSKILNSTSSRIRQTPVSPPHPHISDASMPVSRIPKHFKSMGKLRSVRGTLVQLSQVLIVQNRQDQLLVLVQVLHAQSQPTCKTLQPGQPHGTWNLCSTNTADTGYAARTYHSSLSTKMTGHISPSQFHTVRSVLFRVHIPATP
jgi:hypothetical protein